MATAAQMLPQQIKELDNQRFALTQKIADLTGDQRETLLVIDALKSADKNRRCFRLVGGVLVERTVGEVEAALKVHNDGIEEVIKKLEEDTEKINKKFAELTSQIGSGRQ
eukprot:Gregarina_sp_Pseudo_9__3874@NODE_4018_length_504_cov_12_492473_g3691_i0_p2_GENE_NODE_4018_length_504_cov_12_492473_g3691_i0NODE_4018_length_504_cov_12_492473_g3691_i0_p2_ORF_typecomplete_len110_score30_02Prefoldin_2/PF01920_20/2_5e20DUF615/PF04751_14/0_0039Prefoldin/PF02996_17/0_074FlxA/PF14282_6/0_89FlxA/PF14282_6/5_3DUF5082/PF16888_5/41DUF5082/PF16888_5/0_28DUF5595/PF18077_1/1_1e02DUF5595/PF18077_1/0_13Nsp1_C/PF05064_13/1_7e02Nsp1_C/PF05064_13/0_28MtrG/PF04210_13/0_068Cep57_MT_bd/PF06657_13/2e